MYTVPAADPSPSATPPPAPFVAGLVLAVGAGRRLGGRDKGALRLGEESLVDRSVRVLTGVPGVTRVVVVGPERELAQHPVPVLFAREDPPGGGPAAGLLAGLRALGVGAPGVGVPVAGAGRHTNRTVYDAIRMTSRAERGDGGGGASRAERGDGGGGASRAERGDGGDGASRGERGWVAVLAVDMPWVETATMGRLTDAVLAEPDCDAVFLGDPQGRLHLAGMVRVGALADVLASGESGAGWSMRRLLEPLRVVTVTAVDHESRDIDTPEDLTSLIRPERNRD